MNSDPSNTLVSAGFDQALLNRLFGGEGGAFRHHMGLVRSNATDFYQPTAEAASIQSEKAAILGASDAEQYILAAPEGWAALEEFADLFTPVPPSGETVSDEGALVRAVTLAIEPDWVLLLAPEWRLASAGVCFPTRWSLEGKRLQPLPQIHGVVPELQRQIGRQIEVFFQRMLPREGWGRANWGLSTSARRNQHPVLPYTPISDDTPVSQLFLRVESQNLCKLPATGAMAFGIRILSLPLVDLMGRPSVVAGLRQQLRTMPTAVARYKGIPENLWERF